MLTEHAKTLLLNGARVTGTMQEAYQYAWEQFYTDEVEDLEEFCKWVDEEIGGCGPANIDNLFLAFKHPDNKYLKKFTEEVKQRISSIRR